MPSADQGQPEDRHEHPPRHREFDPEEFPPIGDGTGIAHAPRGEEGQQTHDDPGQPRTRRATRASPPGASVGLVEVIIIIIISRGVGVCVEAEIALDSS